MKKKVILVVLASTLFLGACAVGSQSKESLHSHRVTVERSVRAIFELID